MMTPLLLNLNLNLSLILASHYGLFDTLVLLFQLKYRHRLLSRLAMSPFSFNCGVLALRDLVISPNSLIYIGSFLVGHFYSDDSRFGHENQCLGVSTCLVG